MKKEKIEELFEDYSYDCSSNIYDDGLDTDEDTEPALIMELEHFTQAINQAEKEMKLEWYKKLEKKLKSVIKACYVPKSIEIYHTEIKTKIKELENENDESN